MQEIVAYYIGLDWEISKTHWKILGPARLLSTTQMQAYQPTIVNSIHGQPMKFIGIQLRPPHNAAALVCVLICVSCSSLCNYLTPKLPLPGVSSSVLHGPQLLASFWTSDGTHNVLGSNVPTRLWGLPSSYVFIQLVSHGLTGYFLWQQTQQVYT